jgi:hypothetical protein
MAQAVPPTQCCHLDYEIPTVTTVKVPACHIQELLQIETVCNGMSYPFSYC